MSAHDHAEHSHAGHDTHDHDLEHVKASITSYKLLFGGLLVLTFLTVGVSYIDFGTHFWNFVVGLFIAAVKAGLVAAIFMHLKGEKITIWRFLFFTAFFVAGLFMLSLLSHSDPIPSTARTSHDSSAIWKESESISDSPKEGEDKGHHAASEKKH